MSGKASLALLAQIGELARRLHLAHNKTQSNKKEIENGIYNFFKSKDNL